MMNFTSTLVSFLALGSMSLAFSAPVPLDSIKGQTFLVKGDSFQAKIIFDEQGQGKIWRPDGFSKIQWIVEGETLVAKLESPLESPVSGLDSQGNSIEGMSKLEKLSLVFAESQDLAADIRETYREVYPPESGLPEQVQELDNAKLPFVQYKNLQVFSAKSGEILALPLSSEQSAILQLTDSKTAAVMEDPLKKGPSSYSWSNDGSLTMQANATSTIRYQILESQGLSSVLLAEVSDAGKESIFFSSGGKVDPQVYQSPIAAADFVGTYSIPEFKGTRYVWESNGLGKIISTAEDGSVTEGILTWGIDQGIVFGHRWVQTINGQEASVIDSNIALACEAGTAESCRVSQARTYKYLSRTQDQVMVLRVLDQKVENGLTSWIHVFNRVQN